MKLHLVNDEKIINRTIDAFEEVFPGENLFVVTNRTSSFKWVRKETNVLSRTEFFARKDEFSFSEVYIHLLSIGLYGGWICIISCWSPKVSV